ncbi:molybdopterin converting factor subunit 1 [Kordiimonas pumila]|uniref:Molybdopterin synthase sulfur carrier subunit n=1 Tax=Kordiimonas pumila TaxID=2161677 RepID=A0ABV7D755_9PROT|nr:molybdopterin converting factor subunit 1 [Kordiimonas pumila]
MQLIYFASVRESIGKTEELLSKPEDVKTVQDLIHYLKALNESYAQALRKADFIRVAVNQVHVQHTHPITDTDEIAIFPPVTGG